MVSVETIKKQAASRSIRRSINELNAIINDGIFPVRLSPLRREYYENLIEFLEKVAVDWYQMGFRRCHGVLFDKGGTTRRRVTETKLIPSPYFGRLMVKSVSNIRITEKKKAPKEKRSNSKGTS